MGYLGIAVAIQGLAIFWCYCSLRSRVWICILVTSFYYGFSACSGAATRNLAGNLAGVNPPRPKTGRVGYGSEAALTLAPEPLPDAALRNRAT